MIYDIYDIIWYVWTYLQEATVLSIQERSYLLKSDHYRAMAWIKQKLEVMPKKDHIQIPKAFIAGTKLADQDCQLIWEDFLEDKS